MSVEDWAQEQAEGIRSAGGDIDGTEVARLDYDMEVDAFAAGIVHAFDALLSEEAVEAARRMLRDLGLTAHGADFRAALQAAIAAVTEGGSDE